MSAPIYKGGRPFVKPGIRTGNNTGLFNGTAAPSLTGVAGPGSLFMRTNGVVYINVGTKAAPVWTPIGGSASAYEQLITTRVLTAADNGKTFGLALAAGFTVTLPALSTVTGFHCYFVVEIAPTTAYIVSAAAADLDKMAGQVYGADGADSGANSVTTFSADQLNLVANVSLIGDQANFQQVGTTGWAGQAFVKVGATGATFTG